MSATDFGALTDAQKRVWSAQLWKHGRDQSFWFSNGFIGANGGDMNKPIQRITELTETERGLECVMQLVQDMQGDGVVGDNILEGEEEQLINDAQIIRIDQLRNGARSKGRMAEQATVVRFRSTAKEKLAFWMSDKLDELMFLTISGRAYTLNTDGSTRATSQLPSLTFAADVAAASTNRIIFAGSATSEASVVVGDTMKWATIVKARAVAARKKLKPIRQGGKQYFAIVMSPEQERDLLLDTTYQTIVSRAGERGFKNPLFKNALAVVQGVILYSHNKVFNTLGLGASSKWGAGGAIDGAQAILFGACAAGIALLGNVDMNESDNTDYKNRPGLAAGRKIGMLKPQFIKPEDNNAREDYGIISIKSAAAAS